MSFYVTLPSNIDSTQYKNTQSNYTTAFPIPLSFNVRYEVALVEFTFREYMSMDIGRILIKFPQDSDFRPYTIRAFDNEPTQHLLDRLNNDIINFFAGVQFLSLANKKINIFKDNKDIKMQIDTENVRYQDIFNKLKKDMPKFLKPTEKIHKCCLMDTQQKFLKQIQLKNHKSKNITFIQICSIFLII